jgi:transcription initiation factor TFIIIB Brf1 subunit/transcription initiation factor TFIIB
MTKDDTCTMNNNNNTISEKISDKINALGASLQLTEEIIYATEYIYEKAKEVGLLRGRVLV